jgi:hypothetical protein
VWNQLGKLSEVLSGGGEQELVASAASLLVLGFGGR